MAQSYLSELLKCSAGALNVAAPQRRVILPPRPRDIGDLALFKSCAQDSSFTEISPSGFIHFSFLCSFVSWEALWALLALVYSSS